MLVLAQATTQAVKAARLAFRDALRGLHAVRMPGRTHTTRTHLFMTCLRKVIGDAHYRDRAINGS